jgi:endonuclease/exonuclease/phosphatase family metal-dependent hydrolase
MAIQFRTAADRRELTPARRVVAWVALLIAAAALAARFIPVTNHAVLAFAALSPYLMAAGIVVALLLLARSWRAASVVIAFAAIAVVVEMPVLFADDQETANTVALRLLTANVHEGTADPHALVSIARDRADVVVLQELTPELRISMGQNGIDVDFPYAELDAQPYAAGVGIWSRYPIVGSRRFAGYQLGMVSASIRVPGAAADTVVVALHLPGPWPQDIGAWRQEWARLPQTLHEMSRSAAASAAIVAGDFNATYDMEPFRQLLRNDFRDAAEQSGAGFAASYPADSSVPPLLGIDHVLTFHSQASDAQTVRIPGSDHLGLSTTVHVPR